MTHRILVACEGPTDARRCRHLAYAILAEGLQRPDFAWVSDQAPEDLVQMTGVEPDNTSLSAHFPRKDARRYYRNVTGKKPPVYGHFPDRKGKGLHLFLTAARLDKRLENVAGVLWMEDADGDPSHRKDLEEASQSAKHPVAVACPNPTSEVYLVLGGEPTAEQRLAERIALGFDPWQNPDRLHHAENRTQSVKSLVGRMGLGAHHEGACISHAVKVALDQDHPLHPAACAAEVTQDVASLISLFQRLL